MAKRLSARMALTHGSTQYTRYTGACLPTATLATGCSIPLPGGGFAQDFSGTRTSFSPDWTARTSLDYETVLRGRVSLSAGVGVSYSDGYTVGDILKQPPWVKYDGRVALHFSTWTAALIGNNLSNVPVCDQAASRPLGGAGETSCWLGRGREVRLEVSAQFQGN
jgi:outer membrane receptor protein involved in Fe transport